MKLAIAVGIGALMVGAALSTYFGISWYQNSALSFFHAIGAIALMNAFDMWTKDRVRN
jgi:hypothetical protein